jgi:hypothetical protein
MPLPNMWAQLWIRALIPIALNCFGRNGRENETQTRDLRTQVLTTFDAAKVNTRRDLLRSSHV